MISISANMDEFDIAQEIRQERQIHKGSFLLLEGLDDIRRFANFLDDTCAPINCFGRANLIGALEILSEDGFLGILGLADADFDRLKNELHTHESLIYSDSHDFDLDWACEPCVEKYIEEVGDKAKCAAIGTTKDICLLLVTKLKPLSVLRYVNDVQKLKYRLTDLRYEVFFDGNQIDIDQMIDTVSFGQHASAGKKASLKQLVTNHMQLNYDLIQLTSGHDFMAALGIALRQKLSDRKVSQTWKSEIEIHFRLSFADEHLRASPVFKNILEWEEENPPYLILAPRFH